MELEGALWAATDRDSGEVRKDKNGNTFFTGNVTVNGEKHKVVAFLNKPKEKPNQGVHHLAHRHGIYKALSEWQKNCNPVENAEYITADEIKSSLPFRTGWYVKDKRIENGQPCETTETKPYRVTKLI